MNGTGKFTLDVSVAEDQDGYAGILTQAHQLTLMSMLASGAAERVAAGKIAPIIPDRLFVPFEIGFSGSTITYKFFKEAPGGEILVGFLIPEAVKLPGQAMFPDTLSTLMKPVKAGATSHVEQGKVSVFGKDEPVTRLAFMFGQS